MPKKSTIIISALLLLVAADVALQVYIKAVPVGAADTMAGTSDWVFNNFTTVLAFMVARPIWWFYHELLPPVWRLAAAGGQLWRHLVAAAVLLADFLFGSSIGLLLSLAGYLALAAGRRTVPGAKRRTAAASRWANDRLWLPVLKAIARSPGEGGAAGVPARLARRALHKRLWLYGSAAPPLHLSCDDSYRIAASLLYGPHEAIPDWVTIPEHYRELGINERTSRREFEQLWLARKRGWQQKLLRAEELIEGAKRFGDRALLDRAQRITDELAAETDLFRGELQKARNSIFRLRHPG